ncbi:glycosyltransferase [Microbacteriaceae bacterium VKM Ac-2855]|nr:glycosyltransferase [Microbacteriaceae bacterium VKM Ac-2855]
MNVFQSPDINPKTIRIHEIRYTVIIPTYQRKELLRSTIASVRTAAGDRSDIEIIVVDDGSNDGTGMYVATLTDGPETIYVRQPDRGFRAARARNLGLRVARGLDVVLLDCGVTVQTNFFAVLDDRESCKATVVVFPVVGFSNDDKTNNDLAEAISSTADHDPAHALLGNASFADVREPVFRRCGDDLDALPAPWALAWTCCLTVSRRAPLSDIWFDEEFTGWGGEDLEFALQLYRAGAQFVLDRRSGALHLPHAKSESVNSESSRGNKQYLHAKHRLPETAQLCTVSAIDLNDRLLAQSTQST